MFKIVKKQEIAISFYATIKLLSYKLFGIIFILTNEIYLDTYKLYKLLYMFMNLMTSKAATGGHATATLVDGYERKLKISATKSRLDMVIGTATTKLGSL